MEVDRPLAGVAEFILTADLQAGERLQSVEYVRIFIFFNGGTSGGRQPLRERVGMRRYAISV